MSHPMDDRDRDRDVMREAQYIRLAQDFASLVEEVTINRGAAGYAELGRRLMLWAREAAK